MTAPVRAAWINGAFVVLGAAIAAVVAVFGTWVLQNRQNGREDRLQQESVRRERNAADREARGAARALYLEILSAGFAVQVLGNDRILRRFDPSFDIDVEPSSLQLIASRVSGPEWGDIALAIAGVEGLRTFVNTQVERGRHRLTRGEVCYLRHDAHSLFLAAKALQRLMDPANIPDEQPVPRCTPRPGPIPASVPAGP